LLPRLADRDHQECRGRLLLPTLSVEEGQVTSVASSPDGKTLAAGYGTGIDGGAVFWDITRRAHRQHEHPLPVGEAVSVSVAFSPDGKTLAVGSDGGGAGGVVLWDTTRRARLQDQPLPANGGPVWGVAFSPDGRTLAVGYGSANDGGVVLWDIDPASWRRHPSSIANRNFSRAEWRKYFPGVTYRKTFDWLPEGPTSE